MPKTPPKSLAPVFTSTDLSDMAANFGGSLIGTNSNLPATLGSAGTALVKAGGPLVVVEVVHDVVETIDNVLSILERLIRLGAMVHEAGNQCDMCALLSFTDGDGKKWTIPELLHRVAILKTTIDGEPINTDFAHQLEQLLRDLRWKLPDGTLVPLGQSLGSLLFTGVVSGYRRIP